MPLHPQVEGLLTNMAASGLKKIQDMTPEESRATFTPVFASLPPSQQKIAKTEDRSVPTPAGAVKTRIYTPEGKGPFPAMTYFHGGGFVFGNLDTHDGVCRELCGAVGMVVVSVDYRLSPEHKYPDATDDCVAVTRWVAENAGSLDADPARLAVGGDSAGGNLAAVVSQRLRDEKGPKLAAQLLIYPVARADGHKTQSMIDNAEGYFLETASMQYFINHYLRSPADAQLPGVSPIFAKDFSNLPPALVLTCEFDPLRDEGEDYGKKMQAAGVPVTISRYDGAIHGTWNFFGVLDLGRAMHNEAARWLKEALRG